MINNSHNKKMIATTNEKLLIVSCLQKSIRKGFEDIACMYAGKLYEIDKSNLIQIMKVILLEDIFLSDIDLIHELSSYAYRKNHKKIEIMNFIKLFSQSVKDRTAYDIMEIIRIKEIKDYKEPHVILKNEQSSIIDKFQCSQIMLNQMKKDHPLKKEIFYIDKLLGDYDITTNKKIKEIIQKNYFINQNKDFVLLGLLEKTYQQELIQTMGKFKTGDIIQNIYKQELLNEKWLIDGIDWHTKEGKLAIEDFLKEDTELKKYLTDLNINNLDIVIGLLLFKNNGQQLDKRLFYPTAFKANKLSQKLEIEKLIGHKNFNEIDLFVFFKKDYPFLKQCIVNTFTMPDPHSFPF